MLFIVLHLLNTKEPKINIIGLVAPFATASSGYRYTAVFVIVTKTKRFAGIPSASFRTVKIIRFIENIINYRLDAILVI